MKKAFYLGSFDPITHGHFDIIKRMSDLFSESVIGVGFNSSKKSLFDLNERMNMVKEVCVNLPTVKVFPFEGLAVNFIEHHGGGVYIRGIRTAVDFDYEMQMWAMNKTLAPHTEVLLLPAQKEYLHVSSSLVKEVARLHGNISSLVSPIVEKRLKNKLHG